MFEICLSETKSILPLMLTPSILWFHSNIYLYFPSNFNFVLLLLFEHNVVPNNLNIDLLFYCTLTWLPKHKQHLLHTLHLFSTSENSDMDWISALYCRSENPVIWIPDPPNSHHLEPKISMTTCAPNGMLKMRIPMVFLPIYLSTKCWNLIHFRGWVTNSESIIFSSSKLIPSKSIQNHPHLIIPIMSHETYNLTPELCGRHNSNSLRTDPLPILENSLNWKKLS